MRMLSKVCLLMSSTLGEAPLMTRAPNKGASRSALIVIFFIGKRIENKAISVKIKANVFAEGAFVCVCARAHVRISVDNGILIG